MNQEDIDALKGTWERIKMLEDQVELQRVLLDELKSKCTHQWPDGKGSISCNGNEEDGGISFTCDICGESWYLDD